MEYKDFISKFAEQLEIEDAGALCEDTKFRELEEWDSLAVMELITLYNDEFDKDISDTDIKQCVTLNDLYRLADGQMNLWKYPCI